MSRDVVVRCANLTKIYRVYRHQAVGWLLAALFPRWRSRYVREIEAWQGGSFEVGKGEVFGILGPNGAGKSTLLACLSGITAPDSGEITLRGRIDALLQLG